MTRCHETMGIESLYRLTAEYTSGHSGTSYATPMVAALGVLILLVDASLSASEVREIIGRTADKV